MDWRSRLRHWAALALREVVAVWIAAGDRRTPRLARVVAAVTAAYALSPIDLIPDVIPILGQLDDLVLVPLGLMLAVRLIPAGLMAEFRAAAALRAGRPRSRAAAAAVIGTWIVAALVLGWAWF